MIIESASNISLFTASSESAVNSGREIVPAFRGRRRQAGFTTIELLIVLAIIAIMCGLAAAGILRLLPTLHANQAMYQVITSLREARMLAMSTKTGKVFVQFNANDIKMRAERPNSPGDLVDIGTAAPEVRDPSTVLENGYQFMKITKRVDEEEKDDMPCEDFTDSCQRDPIFVPGNDEDFVFTEDGLLTKKSNFDQPVNVIISIGPAGSNPDKRLMRAVTVLGATGRIRSSRYSDGGWQAK